MLTSINETQKLFKVERIEGGKVDIEASEYLLSLSEKMQVKALSEQLEHLKRDLARSDTGPQGNTEHTDEVLKAQLQLLIQVIEGLLAKL